MDGRISKLEAQMADVQGRMGRVEGSLDRLGERAGKIETGMATLTERVAHLPSKGFIVTTTLTSVGFLTAMLVFGDRIKTLFGG